MSSEINDVIATVNQLNLDTVGETPAVVQEPENPVVNAELTEATTEPVTTVPPSLKLSYTPKGCDNETFGVVLGCKKNLDPTVYAPTDEEIESLKRQIPAKTEHARELLLKHQGNQVQAVLDFYDMKYKTEDKIGIAESSHSTHALQHMDGTEVKGRSLSPENLTDVYRTYLYVEVGETNSFTKKKKYCNLQGLLDDVILPGIKAKLTYIPLNLKNYKLYELTGASSTVLEKWNMPGSALVFFTEQVYITDRLVELGLLDKLNKQATQYGRHSGILGEKEAILGIVYIVGNVDFDNS